MTNITTNVGLGCTPILDNYYRSISGKYRQQIFSRYCR